MRVYIIRVRIMWGVHHQGKGGYHVMCASSGKGGYHARRTSSGKGGYHVRCTSSGKGGYHVRCTSSGKGGYHVMACITRIVSMTIPHITLMVPPPSSPFPYICRRGLIFRHRTLGVSLIPTSG